MNTCDSCIYYDPKLSELLKTTKHNGIITEGDSMRPIDRDDRDEPTEETHTAGGGGVVAMYVVKCANCGRLIDSMDIEPPDGICVYCSHGYQWSDTGSEVTPSVKKDPHRTGLKARILNLLSIGLGRCQR